jgi:hypothetical protein
MLKLILQKTYVKNELILIPVAKLDIKAGDSPVFSEKLEKYKKRTCIFSGFIL